MSYFKANIHSFILLNIPKLSSPFRNKSRIHFNHRRDRAPRFFAHLRPHCAGHDANPRAREHAQFPASDHIWPGHYQSNGTVFLFTYVRFEFHDDWRSNDDDVRVQDKYQWSDQWGHKSKHNTYSWNVHNTASGQCSDHRTRSHWPGRFSWTGWGRKAPRNHSNLPRTRDGKAYLPAPTPSSSTLFTDHPTKAQRRTYKLRGRRTNGHDYWNCCRCFNCRDFGHFAGSVDQVRGSVI